MVQLRHLAETRYTVVFEFACFSFHPSTLSVTSKVVHMRAFSMELMEKSH